MYKDVSFSVKELDFNKRIVRVAIARYNDKDSDGDIILNTAHAKSISEIGPQSNKPRFKHLKNHDRTKTPGNPSKLTVEGDLLVMESKIVETTLGNDTLVEYQEGIITEHSHGFKVVDGEFSEADGAFIIKEAILMEGSSLNAWGANANTPTLGIKSYHEALMLMDDLTKYLKIGSFSDRKLSNLEEQLKDLNKFIEELKVKNATQQAAKAPQGPEDELFAILDNFIT